MPPIKALDGEVREEVARPVNGFGAVEDRDDRCNESRVQREKCKDCDSSHAIHRAERRAPRRNITVRHRLTQHTARRQLARKVEHTFKGGRLNIFVASVVAQVALRNPLRNHDNRRKRNDDEWESHIEEEGSVALRAHETLDREE